MPPAKGDVNRALIASDITHSIQFFWVSPHQKNIWLEYLQPTFTWANEHSIQIRLMDIERSKFALEKSLNLELKK